jgi:hypothetical protein
MEATFRLAGDGFENCPFLEIHPVWRANFSITPTIKDRVHGAVVVQIKLRVW